MKMYFVYKECKVMVICRLKLEIYSELIGKYKEQENINNMLCCFFNDSIVIFI